MQTPVCEGVGLLLEDEPPARQFSAQRRTQLRDPRSCGRFSAVATARTHTPALRAIA